MRGKLATLHDTGRRLLTALFFVVLLMPIGQIAYACQAIVEGFSKVCCCTDEAARRCAGGDCEAHLAGYRFGCCEVSVQTGPANPLLLDTASLDRFTSPPPAAAISFHLALGGSRAAGARYSSTVVDRSGQAIYLTTGRLRI